MAVRSSDPAGGAHLGDVLALEHLIAHTHQHAAVVAVVGLIAVLMVDTNQVAIAAHPAGVGHNTTVRRHNVSAGLVGDVQAAVERCAAENVAIAVPRGDGAVGWPAERASRRPAGPRGSTPGL